MLILLCWHKIYAILSFIGPECLDSEILLRFAISHFFLGRIVKNNENSLDCVSSKYASLPFKQIQYYNEINTFVIASLMHFAIKLDVRSPLPLTK